MDYIVGRDSKTSQLNIICGSQVIKSGVAGSVPQNVSRQHCQITINEDGSMIIKNLKPENVTYVNGHAVEAKAIKTTDSITLGHSQYNLDLPHVLEVIKNTQPKVVDIRPLKDVWEEYEHFLVDHQVSAGKFAALASATGIFTVGAIIMTLMHVELTWRIPLYAGAAIFVIFTVIRRCRDSQWPKIKQEKDHELHQRYVCPNCHQYLGKPYDILIQGNNCPNCKAKFKK